MADLIEMLRRLAEWPDEADPVTIGAIAGEAADALEAAREDAERWNELCRQIDAGEFHPAILDDAMNMGAGALEMHVDDTIDASREARNG